LPIIKGQRGVDLFSYDAVQKLVEIRQKRKQGLPQEQIIREVFPDKVKLESEKKPSSAQEQSVVPKSGQGGSDSQNGYSAAIVATILQQTGHELAKLKENQTEMMGKIQSLETQNQELKTKLQEMNRPRNLREIILEFLQVLKG
jgi:DNA-binding transcriptional MerR regulator